jgi:hypothetical protein
LCPLYVWGGRGTGGACQETCGALTNGGVAIGCLCGRREAGQDNGEVKALVAADFRRRFVAEFGASKCQVLLDGMSDGEGGFDCKQLTSAAAGLLSEVLVERGL